MKKTVASAIAVGLCGLLASGNAWGAAPPLLRSLSFNSPADLDDRAFGIAVDPSDGSFVVTGFTDRSDLGENLNVLVQKYDSSGNMLWQQTYNGGGGGSMQQGRAVAVDGGGNVVVAGLQVTPMGGLDALLIKYDRNGVEQWARTFGGFGDDQGYAVAVDPGDDSIVMAGRFNLSDWLIVKYDANGVFQWSRSYNRFGGFDIAYAVAITSAGVVVVAGDDENPPFGINYDLVVKRYNAAGAELPPSPYIRFNAANDGESALALAFDTGGNLYVAGSGHDPTHPGANWDWLILKYNSAGALEWTRFYSGPSSDVAHSLAVDRCGNVLVAGAETVDGQLDWRVHKYDPTGALLWSTTYAGAAGADDEAAGVALTLDGKLLVAGYETVAGEGQNLLVREYASDLLISCPGDITASATSPAGAAVTYATPTVTDNCAVASVVCSPPSGTLFAIGDTTVTCIATDDGGYTATCAFNVHIKGALEMQDDLIAALQAMSLPPGITVALMAKLQEARAAIVGGDTVSARNSLKAFVNQVNALTGKKISVAQADTLISAANQIRAVLGYP